MLGKLRRTLAIESRYHERRVAFFKRLNNIGNFLSLVAGAAAVGSAFPDGEVWKAWGAAAVGVVTVIGAWNLVIGTGDRIRDHLYVKREMERLEAETYVGECGDADIVQWQRRYREIDADAPSPTHWAVKRQAYNDECWARGRPDLIKPVCLWKRLTANIFLWNSVVKEMGAEK